MMQSERMEFSGTTGVAWRLLSLPGPAFFAYADNYLIDVKLGIIMDVEASRAIRQAEVGAAQAMIERTRGTLRDQARAASVRRCATFSTKGI
jgi:hypothetical protein